MPVGDRASDGRRGAGPHRASRPPVVGVLALVALATAVLLLARAPSPWAPALAVLRGTVQVALISVVLSGVIRDPTWIAVALVVMFGVATTTAATRLGTLRSRLGPVALAMAAGVVGALAVVFLTGAIEFTPRYVLTVGG